jgi:hypothetical protein
VRDALNDHEYKRFQPGDHVEANSNAAKVYGGSETDRKRAYLKHGVVVSQEEGSTTVILNDSFGEQLYMFCDCLDLAEFLIQEEA